MTELSNFELEPEPGERIVVDELPGADPPFIYLHGLASVREGEKSTALLALARRLGRRGLRFDFRGHGASSGELSEMTLTMLVADAAAMLRYSGPAILVGSSLGGLVASWAAATAPDHVVALTLLSPAFGFLPRMSGYDREDGFVIVPGDQGVRLRESVLADAARYDESALPERLSMPTFIVHGTADDVVAHEHSVACHAAIAHARKELWLIENGDHRLNDPIDAIYSRMLEFVERTSERR